MPLSRKEWESRCHGCGKYKARCTCEDDLTDLENAVESAETLIEREKAEAKLQAWQRRQEVAAGARWEDQWDDHPDV